MTKWLGASYALAWDPLSIIVACLVQGGFGALLIPQGFAILGSVFPREHIGKAFSAFGPAHAMTLSLLTVIAIGVLSCLAIPLLPSHARPAGSH